MSIALCLRRTTNGKHQPQLGSRCRSRDRRGPHSIVLSDAGRFPSAMVIMDTSLRYKCFRGIRMRLLNYNPVFQVKKANRSHKEVSCRGGRIRPPRARKGFVKLRSSWETFFARITWSEGSTAFSNRGRMHPRHNKPILPRTRGTAPARAAASPHPPACGNLRGSRLAQPATGLHIAMQFPEDDRDAEMARA